MKKIIELTEDTFDAEVLQANQPVIVDFYTLWCGPCQMLAPLLETLADKYQEKIKFAKVNLDVAFPLARKYKITGVPTLMAFENGICLSQTAGLTSLRTLLEWFEKIAGKSNLATTTHPCS